VGYELIFREDKHEYLLHKDSVLVGRCVSVTQILKATGKTGAGMYTPGSAERGTLIHKMTEVLERGEGDEFGDDFQHAGEFRPYLVAYALSKLEIGLIYKWVEEKLFWFSGGPLNTTASGFLTCVFAGTADRIAVLPDGQLCVIDLKTGGKEKWHRLQLAAYRDAAEQRLKVRIHRTAALYLKKDGSYDFDLVPADEQPGLDLKWSWAFKEWEAA